jgi:hypothetical protein
MKKLLVTTAAIAALAIPAAASAGNAYGLETMSCLDKSVGAAIQAGKIAHPGAKMTAKTIAESPHCAS